MSDPLTLKTLQDAVKGSAAAFRSKTALQPAGGPGSKVFPPTYAGAVYATEKRRIPGHDQPVACVLLDSVQSQANRMEEALQQAVDEGRLKIPVVVVDFTPYSSGTDQPKDMRLLGPVGRISSLQAPHRIADAILRDSLLDGVAFRNSTDGQRIGRVSARDATALFDLCPTALVFGMWDSTGPKGGLGAKFERAMVAEVVGIGAVYGVKTSSRIDPLGIQLEAGPLYAAKDGGKIRWTLEESEARQEQGKPVTLGKKGGKPSEANHGNVTPGFHKYKEGAEGPDPLTGDFARQGQIAPGGVTIDKAEQTTVLSLPALRRLRFPLPDQSWAPTDEQRARDHAARTALAALGLCAAALAAEAGLDLRSRCLLWPEAEPVWTLLDREQGGDFDLSGNAAVQLLADAVGVATKTGLPWREKPLVLTPSEQLVKLVVKSQQLAIQQTGD